MPATTTAATMRRARALAGREPSGVGGDALAMGLVVVATEATWNRGRCRRGFWVDEPGGAVLSARARWDPRRGAEGERGAGRRRPRVVAPRVPALAMDAV